MRKLISIIITAVVVTIGVVGYLITQGNVDAYNGYADRIRPLLLQQDAMVEQIKASTDEQGKGLVDGWIATSASIQNQLAAIKTEEPEINRLNGHLVARAQKLTTGLQQVKIYYQTGNQQALAEWQRLTTEAGAHLDAFVKERDAYFAEKDMVLEE
jgi:hypothetical protein